MEMKSITIAGCGPGSLDYVTPAARHAIETAQLLVGAKRLLDLFPEVAAERIVVGADVAKALDAMAARLGQRTVVLVTGDPGLCSLARPVIRRFGRDACRVIPGISSVHAAFASLGIDWLGARILSAHDTAPRLDPASFCGEEKLAVLAGNPAHAAWTGALVSALLPTHEIHLCENLTLAEESVRRLEAAPSNLASRSILILIRKDTIL
jgi:precorrin-6y C5,15-methyltransferase (decarboxylating) CbiE subunit